MSIHANHKDPHHDSWLTTDPGTSQPQAWCTITPTRLIIFQKLHPLIHHVQNSVLYNKTHTNIPAESYNFGFLHFIQNHYQQLTTIHNTKPVKKE
jgi:hypothetical protein